MQLKKQRQRREIEFAEVSKLQQDDSSIEKPTFYTLCCCVPLELLLGNVSTLVLQLNVNTKSCQTIQMTIHIFCHLVLPLTFVIKAFPAQCDMNSRRTLLDILLIYTHTVQKFVSQSAER